MNIGANNELGLNMKRNTGVTIAALKYKHIKQL